MGPTAKIVLVLQKLHNTTYMLHFLKSREPTTVKTLGRRVKTTKGLETLIVPRVFIAKVNKNQKFINDF